MRLLNANEAKAKAIAKRYNTVVKQNKKVICKAIAKSSKGGRMRAVVPEVLAENKQWLVNAGYVIKGDRKGAVIYW